MPEPRSLDKNTLIPIGAAAIVVLAVVGAVEWFLSDQSEHRAELSEQVREVQATVTSLSRDMEEIRDDRRYSWSKPAQENFALRLKLANPEIQVPDPANPGTYIQSPR
jgi:outer membrane murein-binding lipoprotein Lpp